MTYGFSRDDVGRYLPTYLKTGLLQEDPFEVIDEKGVGKLIVTSASAGRTYTSHPKFKAGVCGEHGGDPKSVRFFSRIGLDYVSCSPFRVPVARLSAAQCVVEDEQRIEATLSKVPPTFEELEEFENDRKEIIVANTYSPRKQKRGFDKLTK